MASEIPIRRCRRVPAPKRGFWRVSSWPEPFDPPPPPRPIADHHAEDDLAGRWDDPDGVFRTLYCASTTEGAIGEKLGDFALNPHAAIRIESFLQSEPDEEFVDDQLIRPLDAVDIVGFGWTLAWSGAVAEARFVDVDHWTTYVATFPNTVDLLVEFGLHANDRRAVLDERRNFTRRLAGFWRAAATNHGELCVRGLRYRSRLPPAWICWALWDPPPLDLAGRTAERVTIEHPAGAPCGRPEARRRARGLTGSRGVRRATPRRDPPAPARRRAAQPVCGAPPATRLATCAAASACMRG